MQLLFRCFAKIIVTSSLTAWPVKDRKQVNQLFYIVPSTSECFLQSNTNPANLSSTKTVCSKLSSKSNKTLSSILRPFYTLVLFCELVKASVEIVEEIINNKIIVINYFGVSVACCSLTLPKSLYCIYA